MNRRTFLRSTACAGTIGSIAGCFSPLDRFRSDEPPGTIGDRDGTPSEDGASAWAHQRFDAANTRFNPDVNLLPEGATTRPLVETNRRPFCFAVSGRRLYWTGSGNGVSGYLRASHLERGDEWSVDYGHDGACPIATPDVVYGSAGERHESRLSAVDADTGDVLWRADHYGANAVHDGDLLYAERPDHVAGIDPETGDEAWRLAFDGTGYPDGGLAASNGTTYAIDSEDRLFAVDATNGGVEWDRRVDIWNEYKGPVVATDELVIVTAWRDLIALDATDGSVRWRYEHEAVPADPTEPAVTRDRVFIVAGRSDPRLVCLDLETGTERWSHPVETRDDPPLAVADGVYYANGNDGLLAISNDGTVAWRFDERPIGRLHAAVGRRLFVTHELIDDLQVIEP